MHDSSLYQKVHELGGRELRTMTIGKIETVLAQIPLPNGWTKIAFCEVEGTLHTWLCSTENRMPLLHTVSSIEEIWDAMLHSHSRAFLPDLAD